MPGINKQTDQVGNTLMNTGTHLAAKELIDTNQELKGELILDSHQSAKFLCCFAMAGCVKLLQLVMKFCQQVAKELINASLS